ncbi:putative deoxyhypusine synthase [Frankliniella fusca]|uniref:Deoxyhypusine synthase n=1 Tax=Frankliniella fusca TaxID=407009 RepID=A0AAE1H1C3_9NEOP|nr:putative deoxyhypusine synthase [Frankliniella fusca]
MQLLRAHMVLLGLLGAGAVATLHCVALPPPPLVDAGRSRLPGDQCLTDLVSSILPADKKAYIQLHGDTRLAHSLVVDLALAEQTTFLVSPRDVLPEGAASVDRLGLMPLTVVTSANVGELKRIIIGEFRKMYVRVVVLRTWASSPGDLLSVTTSAFPSGLCYSTIYMVVTSSAGTTHLLTPSPSLCSVSWSAKELDRCGASAPWPWPRLRVRPLPVLCTHWNATHTAADSRNSLAIIASQSQMMNWAALDHHFGYGEELSRRLHVPLRKQLNQHERVYELANSCNLSAYLVIESIPLVTYAHLTFGDVGIKDTMVVVPSGVARVPQPLRAVTAEFSGHLWAATAVGLLAVILAMAGAWVCRGRAPLPALAAAALEATAPLLAQAPPARPAHRPLTAVWLLMTVVIAAAYQGLLLRELTAPAREINSLEDLERSGLDVRVSTALQHFEDSLLTPALRDRARYFETAQLPSHLHHVSDGRNAAVVLASNTLNMAALVQHARERPKRMHMFELPAWSMQASGVFTKGSPLQDAFISIDLRVTGAGLKQKFWKKLVDAFHGSNRDPSSGEIRALSLRQLLPAFILLGAGHCLAALALAVEVLVHRYARREPLPRQFISG